MKYMLVLEEEEYSSSNGRGLLLLKQHTHFLSKNGLRKRIEQREIRTLPGSNGQVSKICPVSAMRQYLNKDKQTKDRSLFLKILEKGEH